MNRYTNHHRNSTIILNRRALWGFSGHGFSATRFPRRNLPDNPDVGEILRIANRVVPDRHLGHVSVLNSKLFRCGESICVLTHIFRQK